MANKIYDMTVQWTGKHYEIVIPEISATAIGATFDEAIENSHRAIATALMSKRKPRQSRKHQSVA